MIKIQDKKLYELIKKAVEEVLKENLAKLKIALIPYADDKEIEEITQIFRSPNKYKKQIFQRKKL
ncbi:MAG: hypothetical protein OEZ20_07640 [candidate division WOR-3 bacterium]|nr:hypothetical protein [candidate division WOR-3 bacterium]